MKVGGRSSGIFRRRRRHRRSVNVDDVFGLFFRRRENDEAASTVEDSNLVNFAAMFSDVARMVEELWASRTAENFLLGVVIWCQVSTSDRLLEVF